MLVAFWWQPLLQNKRNVATKIKQRCYTLIGKPGSLLAIVTAKKKTTKSVVL